MVILKKARLDAMFQMRQLRFGDTCLAHSRIKLLKELIKNGITECGVASTFGSNALPYRVHPKQEPLGQNIRYLRLSYRKLYAFCKSK